MTLEPTLSLPDYSTSNHEYQSSFMMSTDLMMQSYRNTSLSLVPMKQEHKKKLLEDWLEVYGLQYTIISALKMKRKKLEMTKIFFEVSYTDLLTWQNITLIYIYIYIYTHTYTYYMCILNITYVCMYMYTEYTYKHVFYIYTFFHPFLKIFTFFHFQDMIFVLCIVVEEKKMPMYIWLICCKKKNLKILLYKSYTSYYMVFLKDERSPVSSVQFSSVAQSCLTLCDPMNCSTPGLPVHHQLLEFTQTHVHRVGDAIQPSHPLSSPSPLAPNPSQHQSLFQWVNSSHEVAKVLEFQL